MFSTFQRTGLLLSALVFSGATLAQSGLPQAEGEVRRVDTRAQTVTLKHGDIKNLEMPPMTMVFRVQDPALLSQVKAGDKVRFTADKVGGNYTVMSLQAVGDSAPAAAPSNAPAEAAAPAAHSHKH